MGRAASKCQPVADVSGSGDLLSSKTEAERKPSRNSLEVCANELAGGSAARMPPVSRRRKVPVPAATAAAAERDSRKKSSCLTSSDKCTTDCGYGAESVIGGNRVESSYHSLSTNHVAADDLCWCRGVASALSPSSFVNDNGVCVRPSGERAPATDAVGYPPKTDSRIECCCCNEKREFCCLQTTASGRRKAPPATCCFDYDGASARQVPTDNRDDDDDDARQDSTKSLADRGLVESNKDRLVSVHGSDGARRRGSSTVLSLELGVGVAPSEPTGAGTDPRASEQCNHQYQKSKLSLLFRAKQQLRQQQQEQEQNNKRKSIQLADEQQQKHLELERRIKCYSRGELLQPSSYVKFAAVAAEATSTPTNSRLHNNLASCGNELDQLKVGRAESNEVAGTQATLQASNKEESLGCCIGENLCKQTGCCFGYLQQPSIVGQAKGSAQGERKIKNKQEEAARTRPLADESTKIQREDSETTTTTVALDSEKYYQNMGWTSLAQRYGRRTSSQADNSSSSRSPRQEAPLPPHGHKPGSVFWLWKVRQSCFCHLITSTICYLFPILTSFKGYSLPTDMITDLITGFTIAVLHIPQGMAYGMLANVEPIYGLYVSFVPVLVMALMSKSRHVSYGTFAIISMLLASASDSVKMAIRQQMEQHHEVPSVVEHKLASRPQQTSTSGHNHVRSARSTTELGALIITNNHQPLDESQKLLRNLLMSRMGNQQQQQSIVDNDDQPIMITRDDNPSTSSGLLMASENSQLLVNGVMDVMPTNIEILTCVCLVVGLIQITMALTRLGVLSLMFSDQLVSSFTSASAVHVVTSQLAGLFDMSLPNVPEGLFKVFRVWFAFGAKLYEGFNQYTGLMSILSLIFLLTIKEFVEPALRRKYKSITCLPSELILMIVLITASRYWQFASNYDILIVGPVPTGLPAPQLPRMDLIPWVVQDSITIALISFAMNLSLAQVYAKKFKYEMDPNAELFALGTSNVVGSFYQCFPCASSLSRSAVQSNLDAKSQLCSLFSCIIVASILCYFAPILYDLPRSTLCCIIIVALKGILIQIKDLAENWRLSKLDAIVWMITFVAVLAIGVTYGLLVGIVASLLMVFFRLLTPNYSILGQLPGTDIFVDKSAFTECQEINQVKIFRFNSGLCYLNRTILKSNIKKSLRSASQSPSSSFFAHHKLYTTDCHANECTKSRDSSIKYMIIDCSALAFCDYAGAATLVEIIEELKDKDIFVYLAACPLKLIHMIEKMHQHSIMEENVYPTITDATNHAIYMRNLASNRQLPTDTRLSNSSNTTDTCLESIQTR